ncbi:MAG: hypothetical protein JW878_00160 [Methanomicrobia archaeon]|nr:hypothetical protein [Methanomicrobia archaeon]
MIHHYGGEVAVKSAEEKSGSIKEPVIVVSDVHLGGEASNFREFWDFLTG